MQHVYKEKSIRNGTVIMTKPQSSKGLKEHTYEILKERLIDCVYPPGSLLNEAQLAADLELSRTPIREAISKLEMEGFCLLYTSPSPRD